MKKIAVSLLVILGFAASGRSDLITFEDLSPGPSFLQVFNGYHGLQWSNFMVIDAMAEPEESGYRAGMISPTNVVFDADAAPATISLFNGVFDLTSGYFTAATDSPLLLEAMGYRNGELVYDEVYSLNTVEPLFVTFNYNSVDRVTFAPFTEGGASQFVVDNLTVNVPEPGAVSILVAGASLFVLRRWRIQRRATE